MRDKKDLGAVVLSLASLFFNPAYAYQDNQTAKGVPNPEYHYNNSLVFDEPFPFLDGEHQVEFYEERDNRLNILKITYPSGSIEKYFDTNDDLKPDYVLVMTKKGKRFYDLQKLQEDPKTSLKSAFFEEKFTHCLERIKEVKTEK